jgi:hypothetical protein
MTVFDTYIELDLDYYKVVGENRVYELLENYDLDWIHSEDMIE